MTKMKFYVERYTKNGWERVTVGVTSLEIAKNMKESMAKKYGEDIDNFSILITIT